jgi:predicted ATP-grasp superfamily ATP-dependent carboligase
VETLVPAPGEDPFSLYVRGLHATDAAWPTAPETGGALERLGRLTLTEGRVLLGSHPDAVQLTASKRATVSLLSALGMTAVPTYGPGDAIPARPGPWVIKPDDGAGSEGTVLVDGGSDARACLARMGQGFVAQPWIAGEPLSLSLLCAAGAARVLSCNRQRVRVSDGRVALTGIGVNAAALRAAEFTPLAGRIAAAIPLLWGHVGVDLVASADGPVVLEINPRLTTSYVGVGRALGINPALAVLDLARTGRLPETPPPESGVTVDLDLETAGAC